MTHQILLVTLLLCAGVPVQSQTAAPRKGWNFDDGASLDALPSVPEGFEMIMFAREPLVRNPCSIAFDARGRLFVSMGPQYRNPKPDTPPDSVVIVEDTDGDGVADRTRAFATGFNCIQGLAWHGRDLWVANAPDLTVVRDLDGDDVADEYVRVFTDLGNIEHGLHGLSWAPDGRLYMTKGNSRGLAKKEIVPGEPERIAPKPFRELWGVPGPSGAPDFPGPKTFTRDSYKSAYHDPRDDWGEKGGVLRCEDMGANLEIVARGLRNPYGMAFDHGFDWLATDQDQNEGDRLFMPFYSADFGWSHAWSTHWTGEHHLPTAPISGPVFTGSGTGIIYADSPAWPKEYRGVWLINDWLLKSTQVYRGEWQGGLLQPTGGKWRDFVSGKDSQALYRPVDMAFGADGALYILGWGRGYGVEWDKDNQMSNEGRIYRLMPKNAKPLPAQSSIPMAKMTVSQLTAEFDSLLPVRRIDAQDELVHRGAAIRDELLAAASPSQGRETWALWTLMRTGVEDDFFVNLTSSADASLNARLQALRILGARKSALFPPSAFADPEPRLRFAAVQAAHQGRLVDHIDALIDLAARENDRVTYYAAWHALRDLARAEKLRSLLTDARGPVRCAALLALIDLQAMPTAELHAFSRDSDEAVRSVALLGLGAKSKPDPKAKAVPAAVFAIATSIKAESGNDYSMGALEIGQRCYTDRKYTFQQVPDSLRGAFVIRTANVDDHSQGDHFLAFDLALESTVILAQDTRLKQRPQWLREFTDTDQSVTTDDTTFHLWSKNFPAGRVVLGGNCDNPKAKGFANYFVILQPKPPQPRANPTTMVDALAALPSANPQRGEALFFLSAGCAGCHRTGERGTNFGPDLTNLGDRMESKFVVQSILDPNAVITEGFSAHAVEAGGKTYFGTLLSSGRTLRLGLIGGQTVELETVAITKHETLPVSPMPPQGMLLGPQDVADVSAWLLSQKSAAKPAAAQPSGDSFRFDLREDRVIIANSVQPVAHFVFRDNKVLRPYFAHVHAPGGTQVTRNHPPVSGTDPVDHDTMHPGIWLGFGDISGTDFWRNKGRIQHERFSESPVVKNGALRFTTESSLLTPESRKLGRLTNRLTLDEKHGAWQITWDATFHADEAELVFGDQEEMGFGARVATDIGEKNGGLIRSSTGGQTAKQTWGQPAQWCDYSGTMNGLPAGVTLMASPGNFRESWWHNRDYGVFVANPFGRAAMKQGEKSAVTVKPGESLRLVFRAVLHRGEGYDPARAFETFNGETNP